MEVEEQCTSEVLNSKEDKSVNFGQNLYSIVHNAVNDIIKKEGYISYNVHTKAIIPDGGNYLASLYEIDIIGVTVHDKKETNLFLKQAIPSEGLYDFLDIEGAYLKEVYFYTELSIIFDKLQTEASIPSNKQFKSVKCYSESCSQAIIMENLTKKGYKVPFRMDVMSLDFAQLSVQQLARFHALSFVVQKNMPEYFHKKVKNIKTILNLNDKYIELAIKSTKTTVKHFHEDIRREILDDLPGLIQTISKYVTEKVSSVNCICHGDFRMNNILGKDEFGDIIDVVPIDYQFLYYGCPVTDLLYLLYSSCDAKFRQLHERDLKSLYWHTIKDFLRYFDINIENVIPRNVFEEDYENMRDFGFYVTFVLLPLCFIDESKVIEPGSDLINEDFHLDKRFFERVAGLPEEYKIFKNKANNLKLRKNY